MSFCGNCFREKNTDGFCPFCGWDGADQERKYPVSLRIGSILNGRYIVGRVLGQGGFGVTYLAQDYQTRERVAVKEYYPAEFAVRGSNGTSVQILSDNRAANFLYGKEQFLEEAKTLAAVSGSGNIIRIYSYFEENGTAYFAMEYVNGLPLDEYIRKLGRCLTAQEAETLFLPLMAALENVHRKGIVHRDISPDNILITEDGTAKLIDFGAARYSSGEKSRSLDVILKHGFAPYEQYMRRGRQGPWTDVYALAATFYFAVTGKVPPEAVERMAEDSLRKPMDLGIQLGTGTEAVLMKALSVQAQDRWQNMGEFRAALQAAAMAEVGARRKAEQERLAREQKEHEARERAERIEREKRAKSERLEREKQEKAERAAQKKAEREARKTAEKTRKTVQKQAKAETASSGARKKNLLPIILAAVLILALVIFGAVKMTGREIPAVTQAPAPTEPEPAQLVPAEASPTATEAPGDLPAETETENKFAAAKVGDLILFGAYEQDNDEGNGKEDIEWKVLAREGDRLLVISRYALDSLRYHDKDAAVTWETSSLRSWLNSDFLNGAFSAVEQRLIPTVAVRADKNPQYPVDPGNDTWDQVFLLSCTEVETYFDYNEARGCEPTDYAVAKGTYVKTGYCNWWLRSPGSSSYNVACIDGFFFSGYHEADLLGVAVRPAMWIDVNATEGTGTPGDAAGKAPSDDSLTAKKALAPEHPATPFGLLYKDSADRGVSYSREEILNAFYQTFVYDENGQERRWLEENTVGTPIQFLYEDGLLVRANLMHRYEDRSSCFCMLRFWGDELLSCNGYSIEGHPDAEESARFGQEHAAEIYALGMESLRDTGGSSWTFKTVTPEVLSWHYHEYETLDMQFGVNSIGTTTSYELDTAFEDSGGKQLIMRMEISRCPDDYPFGDHILFGRGQDGGWVTIGIFKLVREQSDGRSVVYRFAVPEELRELAAIAGPFPMEGPLVSGYTRNTSYSLLD